MAVAKALPNFVLAGIAAAMGAAQIAVIASQPIPKYAKGTDSHKGGLAVVGDGGVPETIVTEKERILLRLSLLWLTSLKVRRLYLMLWIWTG